MSTTSDTDLKSKEEWLKGLPRKRVGACALFFCHDELLIVKPNYKPDWALPGGVVELNESPFLACQRESREELGAPFDLISLAAVDYFFHPAPGAEAIEFLFRGQDLTNEDIGRISLQQAELTELKFVDRSEAHRLLSPGIGARVSTVWGHALKKSSGALYLENGILKP